MKTSALETVEIFTLTIFEIAGLLGVSSLNERVTLMETRPEAHEFTAADYGLTKAAYRIDEIPAITGVCRNKVYNLAHAGEFPLVKFGRSSRILTPDIVRFLNRHRAVAIEGA